MYVQAVFAQQTSDLDASDIRAAIGASHGDRTPEQFRADVSAWLDTARHPRFNARYDELTYAPMVELLTYLQDHAFTAVISSGGGQEFMRVFAERAYGIPNGDVIGSTIEIEYDTADGQGGIYRTMKIANVNNEHTKPTGIWNRLGKRPIMAFGNSDGDQQMLEWVGEGEGLRLCGLVHHTDAEREYAYDWPSEIGGLNTSMDEAKKRDWIVVDMAKDWETVFTAKPAP